MDETADLVGPRKRRLRIIVVAGVAAAAVAGALLVRQRGQARKDAADHVRAIAVDVDRCIVGADGIPDDAIYDRFVARELEGHGVATRTCDDAARAKVQDLDLDELPDAAASLARAIDTPDFSDLEDPARAACDRVDDVRRAIAAFDGRTQASLRCELRPSDARVLETEHVIERRIEGGLLSTVSDDDERMTLRRYRPDGGVAAEVGLDGTDRYAIDGDDVVFATPEHLSRWRGDTRTDGPALSKDFGLVRAWRRTPTGAIGVFWNRSSDGFRVQAFDDALRPVGPSRVLAGGHDDGVAIGAGGEVAVAAAAHACATDRTMWTFGDGIGALVQSAPIGQPPAGDAHLDQHLIGYDCDDAHLYVVSDRGYITCDRTRCTDARTIAHLEYAGIRAHDGGAEVLARVDDHGRRVLVSVRDPRGDGRATLDVYDMPSLVGPVSFRGRWFLLQSP